MLRSLQKLSTSSFASFYANMDLKAPDSFEVSIQILSTLISLRPMLNEKLNPSSI